ncbi:MAG: hypothetical protein LBU84_00685, partial [Prevotella sp.]|nr:hypothetical protein [Prevotella sp.]
VGILFFFTECPQFSQANSLDGISSLFSILPSGTDSSFDATANDEMQQPKKKKKKPIRGLRR